jgi:hypothetical protein
MTKALGMDAGDLKTALAGGQTLADVAKSRGVAKDDLVAATAKDMQANAPAGAPALDDAKAAEMATNLVEGKHPPPGGHHGPPPGAPAPSDATGTPPVRRRFCPHWRRASGSIRKALLEQSPPRPGVAAGSAGLRSRRKPRGVVRQMSNRILGRHLRKGRPRRGGETRPAVRGGLH